jgi:hypothetical protein
MMRRSSWTPSIVPNDNDETVYLVADDFGRFGHAWCEADYETTDLETVIQDLLTGQYSNPIRVVAFNTAERWSEDVSEDVAAELRRRCDLQMRELPSTISDFVERHEDRDRRQLTLRSLTPTRISRAVAYLSRMPTPAFDPLRKDRRQQHGAEAAEGPLPATMRAHSAFLLH